MKTKFFFFITSLVLGITMKANTPGKDLLPTDILKNSIKDAIEQEAYKWDYSTLSEKNSAAAIAFKISSNGEILVNEVVSNDKGFKSLIENNLPKIKLTSSLGAEEVFYIHLKHKTI